MAINRYKESNFPVDLTWRTKGDHVVRIENQISALLVGTSERLTDATIGQAIKVLEDGCFLGCTRLSSLSFVQDFTNADEEFVQGTRLQKIGVSAFANCTGLHKIEFNEDLVSDSIGDSAFRNSGISSIAARTGSVGSYAFEKADELTDVRISASENIGQYAFANAGKLTDVRISASESIGKYAFARSPIRTANISCGSSSSRMFHNCTTLEDAVVDAKVLKFGDFAGCTSLTSLTLNSLEKIDLTLPDLGLDLSNFIDDADTSAIKWWNDNFSSETTNYTDSSSFKHNLKLGVFHDCAALTGITFPQSFRGIDPSSIVTYSNSRRNPGATAIIDSIYIDTATIPLFYHTEIPEINFDLVPNRASDQDESAAGISVVLYPLVFSEINPDGSSNQTVIRFNDTYDQIDDIVIDKYGRHILKELIATTLSTNRSGSIIFQFKDSTFDPSVLDTLLAFADTNIESINHAVPFARDPSRPETANVCISCFNED